MIQLRTIKILTETNQKSDRHWLKTPWHPQGPSKSRSLSSNRRSLSSKLKDQVLRGLWPGGCIYIYICMYVYIYIYTSIICTNTICTGTRASHISSKAGKSIGPSSVVCQQQGQSSCEEAESQGQQTGCPPELDRMWRFVSWETWGMLRLWRSQ